jgi:hypothetical protein
MPLTMQDSSKLVDMLRSSASLPAAKIDGDVFVRAAQSVGIPDDMNTLNKIVSLVNQGKSPNEAALIVAKKLQGVQNATR